LYQINKQASVILRLGSALPILGVDKRSEVAAVVPNGGACCIYNPQAPPLGTAAATSETEPGSWGVIPPPDGGSIARETLGKFQARLGSFAYFGWRWTGWMPSVAAVVRR